MTVAVASQNRRTPHQPLRLGDNGGAAPDSSPRSFPGYGERNVARPIARKQMPGWQIWQGPEMGEAPFLN